MRNNSIFQDWNVNKGNLKGRFVMLMFRTAYLIRNNKLLLIFFFWFLPFYILLIEWLMGIELTLKLEMGKNTQIWHGQGLVINYKAKIGDNCLLRHCTTIGNKGSGDDVAPIIGNNVNIGANVCIIGGIIIGDNVVIGSGSVVTKSIQSNSVVVGNPARVIRQTS